MTHPIENCPKYTAEQVEAMAAEVIGGDLSRSKRNECSSILDAYATTLRQQSTNPPEIGSKLVGQQGEQAGGVVSEGVAERALMAFEAAYDTRVDGPGSPYANDRASCIRAALEAVAPLLSAPAEQCGRVDNVILREAADEALTLLQQLDPQHGITTQLQAALAQNGQGETPNKRATGIYHKFNVTRTDGSDRPGGKHEGCDYFVLDLPHDPFAKPAATAYADACESEYSVLAADMRKRYGLHAGRARVPEITDVLAHWVIASVGDVPYATMTTEQVKAALRENLHLLAAPSQPEDASHD